MTAKTTRILKEARPLLFPWCAVIVAGVLPLLSPLHSIAEFSPIVFVGGILLLATLSLGNEFQHRTFSLLLTQPVDRMEIWGEKLSVTIVAVVSEVLIFFFVWRVAALQLGPLALALVGVGIIATIASATFWTLFARSTLGGMALTTVVPYFMIVVTNWRRIRETGHLSPTVVSISAFFLLCYAGGMLWLGRRALARFQVTGGMAGDDLLMAGADVMPGALAGWFRCRPTGAVLNLIRKELRLLRPLWLITLLVVLGWACLIVFGLVPVRGSPRVSGTDFPAAMAVIFSMAIAFLAGSLSLGEERTLGTHAWHMTLPVSARRQWLIKLCIALLAGVVGAVLLPVLVLVAGRFLSGSPFLLLDPHALKLWLVAALLLSFASFWCACAVNGTVRAALWICPVIGALLLAGQFGDRVAPQLVDLVVSRMDPFTRFGFTNAVSNIQFDSTGTLLLPVTVLLVPALLFAVIQSYRLFRVQPQDSTRSVVRNLLPLVVIVFLCGFFLAASLLFVNHAKERMWSLFHETHEAIEKIEPGAAKLDATHPLQLTAEDLDKASPLSERARRWLGNSTITVAPDKPHPGPYCCGGNSRGIIFVPDKDYSWYLATIYLPGGSHCTLSFQAGRGYGILGGACE